MTASLTPWRRWLERPRSLWIRKALFQIHLWMGIAVALYVLVVSISGSALVYRRELESAQVRRTVIVKDEGRTRISPEALQRNVARACPGCEILNVIEPPDAAQPDAVILLSGKKRFERLFDPYTGADLGSPFSSEDFVIGWLADLHDNLLAGQNGRTWNGFGSFLLVLLSLTGAVLWWPGIKNWRRGTRVQWRARLPRVNWDLHSAVGFWCSVFVLIWGISGIGLCFPGTLDILFSSEIRVWLTRLHFGRFNVVTEGIWTLLGLAPAALAVTGVLMWWNRVLSKKIRRS